MLNQLSTELPFPVGAPALAAEEEGEGQINTMVMKCVHSLLVLSVSLPGGC